jgi:hypothetical protein
MNVRRASIGYHIYHTMKKGMLLARNAPGHHGRKKLMEWTE